MRLRVRKRKKFVVKLIILSVIAYCVYSFVSQRIKIKTKSDELDYINKQIAVERKKTEEIREKIDQASRDNENDNAHTRVFENAAE